MVPDPRPDRATPRRLASHLLMLGRTAAQLVDEDPVRFSLLAVRRLPTRVRGPVGGLLERAGRASGRPAAHALGLVLADHPDAARDLLADDRPGRLGAEVAVELGLSVPPTAPASVRAREAWQRGDLAEAVATLRTGGRRERRQAARLESERRTHLPEHRVTAPSGPVVVTGEGPRSLHLLTNSLPWTQSGYALRSHAVLRAQSALGITAGATTRVGYPVTVGLPWAADRDVVDGVAYTRMLPSRLAPTAEQRLEQGARLLADHARRERATVLHTTTHFPNALVTEAAARATGLPWVYEMRGQLERTWVAGRPEGLREHAAASERYRLWRDRELEMARAADHVVVLSQVLRDEVVARGLPPERVTVVPNAVDATLLDDAAGPTEPAAARRDLGLPDDGFWVGTVSSLVGYEGIDVLLHAVALLRADGVDVRCAVVGDGVSRPSLVRLADELGLGTAAVLPGRVPPAQAVRWHRALDVFVVPRRDVEVARTVTPLKPVEAMAVGRPVVASDLPALAEVVGAPGAGLLVRPEDPRALADRLRDLQADPALRRRLAARGRDVAATRTWRAMALRYRTVYENVGSER